MSIILKPRRILLQLPPIIPQFPSILGHFSPPVRTLVSPQFLLIPAQLGTVMPEFSAVALVSVIVVSDLMGLPAIGSRKAPDGSNKHQRTQSAGNESC
jgi:hypothetical protein